MLARESHVLGHSSQQLHHLSEVVIVFVVVVALAGLKEEVTSHHFENGAGKAPDVSGGVVVSTDYDLWRAVLPGLDLRGKVVVSPATIAHVANLNHYVLVDLGTPAFLRLTIFLLLLGFIIVSVKKQSVEFLVDAVKAGFFGMFLRFGWQLLVFLSLWLLCRFLGFFLVLGLILASFFLSVLLLALLPLPLEFLPQVLLLLGSESIHVNVPYLAFFFFLGFFRQGTGYLHVDALNDVCLIEHLSSGKLPCLCYFLDFIIAKADHHVLWLEVSVNDLAHAVKVV